MEKVKTAYSSANAKVYDKKRLSSKQGRLLDKLEKHELEQGIKRLKPSAKLLEVGSGTGRFSIPLAERGFDVTGCDPSPHMIEEARNKTEDLTNIRFIRGEGKALKFENNTFDFVYTIRVLNHVESRSYALSTIDEMLRVVKSGGYILIEFTNSDRPFMRKINPNKVRLTFDEIVKYLNSDDIEIISKRGAFLFSMGLIENRLPEFMVPIWEIWEKTTSKLFSNYCSRGYLLLKKK